jgi:glutamate dehydrogenase/leucine dehydrogenase
MIEATDLDLDTDHERVRVVRDPEAGLLAVIAIHSTALGPAMGGVRRRAYASLDAAIDDVLRLSSAMTLKNSAAGLPLGGGKSVIVDGSAEPSGAVLDAFAAALEELGGSYVVAEDIGTTPAHMDRIGRTSRWVSGLSAANGGSDDPSPSTARTVFGGIRAAARLRWGSDDLRGRRVGVLGVGKVGGGLAARLAAAGADLVLADVDAERAHALARTYGDARVVEPGALLAEDVEVLAPCATGGVLTTGMAAGLSAEIVCGAANNILLTDAVADELSDHGILYVPDFVANAGGIIHAGGRFLGWDDRRIGAALDAATARVGDVLAESDRRGVPPLVVAHELAQARLGAAAGVEG